MKRLLIISYWIGIIADSIATILLFFPKIASIILNSQPFEITPAYLYIARIAGSLVLGWTVLLIWAVIRPIERADILIITIFPVVTLLTLSAILVVKSNKVSLLRMMPIFIVYIVIFSTYIPSYCWAKKQNVIRR